MDALESTPIFRLRKLEIKDLEQINALQVRYAEVYPGAACIPVEVYQSPGFAGGENIFCAVGEDQRVLGFGPMLPAFYEGEDNLQPNRLWADIKVEPELSNREAICEELLKAIRQRGGELVKSRSDRFTQLVFQYFPFEEEIINFLFCRGFVHTESVYTLTRDLTDPIPDVLFPPGIQIQHWKMERQVEKQQYVEARNRAFPESQITVDDWNYFLHSPLMEVGMNFGAFDGEELIGCITVFWDEKQNKLSGEQVGSTEYLFVTPAWRGLGLGRCLLAQGMHYLKKQGMIKAQLEVRASNAGALGLYTKLGYKITRESWFLVNSL